MAASRSGGFGAHTTILCSKLMAFILVAAAYNNTHGHGVAASSTTHLHFYMDDFYTGPNPTALRVVSGRSLSPDNGTATTSSPRQFGDIVALNDPLTEGPDRGSARVGTAQGFAVRVSEGGVVSELSMHLVLEAGEYGGSSLAVNGHIDPFSEMRESVIVGGTRQFRFARGYLISRNYQYDLANGGVVELDVYVLQ